MRHLLRINGFKGLLPKMKAVISPSHSALERVKAEGYSPSKLHRLPYFCGMPCAASPRPIPKKKTYLFHRKNRSLQRTPILFESTGSLASRCGRMDHG
jgi:hypothetical protein